MNKKYNDLRCLWYLLFQPQYNKLHQTFRKKLASIFWWLLLYSAILCSRADTLRPHVILHEWLAFYSTFLNIHLSGVLTVMAWQVPHETAAISVQVLCTPYNHAPCHFMQSHIHKVYVCLDVTATCISALNDRDLLHATAVTWGWNGYRNKSWHRKLTLEKKILLLLLQGLEPATFQSQVWCSNHWIIPTPFCLLTGIAYFNIC